MPRQQWIDDGGLVDHVTARGVERREIFRCEKGALGALRVSTQVVEDGAHVFASFADEGSDAAPQVRDKAWNPFYTTKPSGTGLGLPIFHAIVEEHGGRTVLESKPGRGTTFTVLLPRAA